MRVLSFDTLGDPATVLRVSERPDPTPGPGEARVRVTLAPIHNHDLMSIRGRYGSKPQVPAVAGSEAAGVVDAIGSGVTQVKVGQRVTSLGVPGSWADTLIAKADRLVPLPDSIDDNAGCQLMAMPMSALLLLYDAAVPKGEWLAQNAANGAVGKAVAKIAAERGAQVLNIVRRTGAVNELATQGIHSAIATDQPKWWQNARDLTKGARIPVGVDSVGGEASGELLRLLSDGGRLISFGAMGQGPMAIDPGDLIFKGKTVNGFWAMTYRPKGANLDPRSIAKEVIRLVTTKVITLPVDATYPLERISDALRSHDQPGRNGKIALKP